MWYVIVAVSFETSSWTLIRNCEYQFSHRYNPKMDPSYTQDLRNRPKKHPETPIDAILILVR